MSSLVIRWLLGQETGRSYHGGLRSALRELRTKKGLSQEALALDCGLDRTYIGGIERGERNVSLVNIEKIAAALGVSVRVLF